MIKSLSLYDWKSFKESKLYIDPLTIIIGTNASGKSNTLDALLFLNRIANGVGIFQAINGDVSLPSLRGGVEWICRKPSRRFTLEVIFEIEELDYKYLICVEVENTKALIVEEKLTKVTYSSKNRVPKEKQLFYTNLKDPKLLSITSYYWTGSQGKGQNFDLNRNISVLTQTESLNLKKKEINEITKSLIKYLKGVFVFDPIPSHMRDYSALNEELLSDGSNIAGVLAALEPELKISIENQITEYLKDIPEKDIKRVWAEKIGKFNSDAMLYCEEGWQSNDSHLIDARGMSDGTLRYLGIVTAMLTRKPGDLLVVEEVDNGLHPSRAHILLNMLIELGRSRKIDVIVTTHNPALLDAAGVELLPFITIAHRNKETGYSTLKLLEDINELPKLLSFGNIGSLSASGQLESALSREDS